MRNVHAMQPAREPRAGAATKPLLCAALGLCLAFLAAQNTILLLLVGPSIEWPPALAGLGTFIGVLRVLMDAFLPWAIGGAALFAAGAVAAWGAVRVSREVRHA